MARLGIDPAALRPESADWARGFNDGVTAVESVSSGASDVFDE
jgi:hypothetical protein